MEKRVGILWRVSLLIIACVSLIIAVSNMTSLELPDIAKRILGIIDLLSEQIDSEGNLLRYGFRNSAKAAEQAREKL